jgi:hypothetical protein
MRRAAVIAVFADLALVAIVLYSSIKDFLWTHPWWHSFLVAIPTIALPILAFFELRHSSEANTLRSEANELRRENARLIAELDTERNMHLEQIARNTQRAVTQSERNAGVLRKHLREHVAVSEGDGTWGNTPEIVEVGGDDIVTLFTPRTHMSSRASCVRVRCGELEITEIPQGGCPLRVRILKRYGPDVDLGEITRWEDRFQPAARPVFAKGGRVYHATYAKPGSSETRRLNVYAASDGANSFLLETATEQICVGDNVEVSKRFMVLQVEYEAAGFVRNSSGTGGGTHRVFIH